MSAHYPGRDRQRSNTRRAPDVSRHQGVATDGERYFVSSSTALYVYDKEGALLLENDDPFRELEQPANHIGDISVHAGELYAGIEHSEADNLWRAVADPGANSSFVAHAWTFTEFRRAGEIEGLDFDRDARELVVLSNRGKRIALGMPKGLYPGYDREIHELYVYAVPAPR